MYLVLILLQLITFILTYIIPKGLFDTIEYSSEENLFIIKINGKKNSIIRVNATQEELDKRDISVSLDSFLKGIITRPLAIPNTYDRINENNGIWYNIFDIFSFPMKGLIDSSDICFYLFITGGALNILDKMKIFSSGMKALNNRFKSKFYLLIVILVLAAFGGTTFGLFEEIINIYPIIMPFFINKNNKNSDYFDGLLSMSPLFLGSICGNMFSTITPSSVVLASNIAGIDFLEGFFLRLIGLILSLFLTIGYLWIYYHLINNGEGRSFIDNDTEEKLLDKYEQDEEKKQNDFELRLVDEKNIANYI